MNISNTLLTTTLLLAALIANGKEVKDSDFISLKIAGHVIKNGDYQVPQSIEPNLQYYIDIAGGFAPLRGFEHEATSSVGWIQRELPYGAVQLIIIDFKNRQILSQRQLKDSPAHRMERYEFDEFEFQEGDVLFVTTSRKSLDLVGYRVIYVEKNGWTGLESLRYFGKSREETKSLDESKKDKQREN